MLGRISFRIAGVAAVNWKVLLQVDICTAYFITSYASCHPLLLVND